MSIISSYWVSVVSPMKLGSKMPAELIRMSMRPKAAFTSADQRLDRADIAHVADKGLGRTARRLNFLRDALRLGQIRGAGDGDARTLGGESQCDRLADA